VDKAVAVKKKKRNKNQKKNIKKKKFILGWINRLDSWLL